MAQTKKVNIDRKFLDDLLNRGQFHGRTMSQQIQHLVELGQLAEDAGYTKVSLNRQIASYKVKEESE